MRGLGIVLLALVLAAGPVSFAQDGADATRPSSEVTFYGHVFGHGLGLPMPANTERPVGEDNYGIGGAADCTSALPADPAVNAGDCRDTGGNTLALFSSAGFVDVGDRAEFLQKGSYVQFHNERGQTKDILLDPSKPITARVFMTMDAHGWFVGLANPYGTNCAYPHPPDVPCLYPSWGWDPGVYPNVIVTATLYKANLGSHGANASDAPPIAAAIAEGHAEVVAEAQWGPDVVMNGLPGSPNVNEFVFDLGPAKVPVIPRAEDFFVVYRVYHEAGGQNFMVDAPFRWWSGELFPPTFTLPVKNAFDVERVIPNFAHGKLALLGVMNTPWGSYDIDPRSVELTVDGPNGDVEPQRIARFGDFSVAHGGHYLPINITWIWDYQGDRLRPGTYTVTVTAHNFQHTATASCAATFELKAGRSDQAPPVPGKVEEGVCGFQSASEEFLEGLKEGAAG